MVLTAFELASKILVAREFWKELKTNQNKTKPPAQLETLTEKTLSKRHSEVDKSLVVGRRGGIFKIENSWEKQTCQIPSLFVAQKGKQWSVI